MADIYCLRVINKWILHVLFYLLFCCTYRDRLRTTTNVLGDSIGAGIIEFLSKDELQSGDVELGSSVLEENEVKKPYQMIPQENDYENEKPPRDSETKM